MEPTSPDSILDSAPPEVDVDAIRREWLALYGRGMPQGGDKPRPYDIADRQLPVPIWARRPFTETGVQAWRTLCREVPAMDARRAFCIYVHIPFCQERCHFCDCYSFRLASHREQYIDHYLDLLDQEVRLWSGLGTLATRPVSTVHLGGGTPTVIGVKPLERLLGVCRARFATDPATEWALESTASALTPEMLSCLDALGVRRLHVGVQSLQDEVRRLLNRRATAAAVLNIIAGCVERGWIVSVDLIYGLPGQTLAGLLGDIRSLAAVGVSGFSLYELQLSSRNRLFAQNHGLYRRDRQVNYWLAQAASRLLMALGYRKTLFNHYADVRDTNLYFTFPQREEDCLALGTIADGSFGDYHYRHPEFAPYRRSVNDSFPGLQGGLRRNELENRLQPLTVGLLAGRVSPSAFADPLSEPLRRQWLESRLLAPSDDPQSGDLLLTGNGSWFVGNMISQMMAFYQAEMMAADE